MPGLPDRPQDHTLQPGPLPGGLEFIRMLGQGADGWVCLARDVPLDRLVAAKVLFGAGFIPGGSARLVREGMALAALHHPNIVRVHRLVPFEQDAVLCEEFVDGPTLADAMRDSSHALWTSAEARFRFLREVADAVEHCGARGVVHRDLKPSNILLTARASAKVADFGLARLTKSAAAFRTTPGVVSGTPGYSAPEQVNHPDRESPTMDRYSFTVVALEVLTGQRVVEVGLQGLLEHVPLALLTAFREGVADDPAVRRSPSHLVQAVALSGWHGISPRSVPVREGPSDVTTDAQTVGTGSIRLSLSPGPAAPASPQSSVPLPGWMQPASVPIRASHRWRRHPAAVGVAGGIVVSALLIAFLELIAR